MDTGSTFTATPRQLLQRLGVPVERSLPVETADGRIVPVDVGATTIRLEQLQFSTEVIFAKEGEPSLSVGSNAEICNQPRRVHRDRPHDSHHPRAAPEADRPGWAEWPRQPGGKRAPAGRTGARPLPGPHRLTGFPGHRGRSRPWALTPA